MHPRLRTSLLLLLAPLVALGGCTDPRPTGVHGRRIWGTRVPYDATTSIPARSRSTSSVDGKFYFFADDGVHGRELWRSDGTALGTFLIRDLCPGTCGIPLPLLELDWRPWATRSSSPPTTACTVSSSGSPTARALGTRMVARSAARLRLLVHPETDQPPAIRSSSSRSVDDSHSALWRTDGTAKGTYAITPPGPTESFAPTSIHPGPGFLYLCNAAWGGQAGLWRSDGSSTGTTFVAAVDCWQNSIGKRGTMTVEPDRSALFPGLTRPASNDDELWRSDGTAAGTWRVKDICARGRGLLADRASSWLGSELLFTASGARTVSELWRTRRHRGRHRADSARR